MLFWRQATSASNLQIKIEKIYPKEKKRPLKYFKFKSYLSHFE